jgi:hypothetical protein
MKKIITISAGAAVAAIILGLVIFMNISNVEPKAETSTSSKYVEANSLLKERLAQNQIKMSSPIKLEKPETISKYCSLFSSPEKQKLVQYCTSTELKDANGAFLGNIHMVGTSQDPKVIMTLIQTDNEISKFDSVKTAFRTVSDTLVCDCWSQKKPGNQITIDNWIEGLRDFQQNSTQTHSKSSVLSLEGKSLQLELTRNNDGYLWQFFIYL